MASMTICTLERGAPEWPAKHPAATLDYAIDFEYLCARKWDKWWDVLAGQRIRVFLPGQGSGFEFSASVAGRTAGRYPTWPSTVAQSVKDGGVTWAARAISADSLERTLSGTPAWVGDAGITISDVSVIGLRAIAKISGGIDGARYAVVVTATTSDGLTLVQNAILPVCVNARL